ncbi:hypothetical protein [Alicyclobacillus sp. SO9]|uniref:hypothetical protein n=1 Tax=Alicyclobacillus sp. SO9 TaxID=2665646 RepID=UPI0018E8591B|nr:hypothetical protein [Alicyclobacillus sp. SO9]QQE81528.1 hypothetical protein GI364_24830 [Alicyclobacillus sp. SO9]
MSQSEEDSYLQHTKMRNYVIAYELILSLLYVWSTFEAYTYDAKARNGQWWIYVLLVVLFAVFANSVRNIVIMNVFTAIGLPIFLLTPAIQHAGSYSLSFQPFIGWIELIVFTLGQSLLVRIIKRFVPKYMTSPTHLKIGGIVMVLFTLIMTVITIVTPVAVNGAFS